MFLCIVLPHSFDGSNIGPLRHIHGMLYRVEIWHQGYCNPIQLANPEITADHYPRLPRLATPQQRRCFCTNVIEINCRMTCWCNATEEPVRLLNQECDIPACPPCSHYGHENDQGPETQAVSSSLPSPPRPRFDGCEFI